MRPVVILVSLVTALVALLALLFSVPRLREGRISDVALAKAHLRFIQDALTRYRQSEGVLPLRLESLAETGQLASDALQPREGRDWQYVCNGLVDEPRAVIVFESSPTIGQVSNRLVLLGNGDVLLLEEDQFRSIWEETLRLLKERNRGDPVIAAP